jgi:hypothetical protein
VFCLQEHTKMNKTEETIKLTLLEKGGLKQDVFEQIEEVFSWLKFIVKDLSVSLKKDVQGKDSRVEINFKEINKNEFQLTCGGDILLFQKHSNVFKFDTSHALWQTGYLKDDESNGFCGMIYMHNFLKDSLKFKRQHDLGYLVGRMFVNKEKHFFLEGKKQLGFLYNNFSTEVLSKEKLKEVVLSTISFVLAFDLFIPPYSEMNELAVYQLIEMRQNQSVKTAKRLGFKFSDEMDVI